MTRHSPGMFALFALLGGACTRSTEPPPAPPTEPRPQEPASPDVGGLGAPKLPWKDKTRAQRTEYMGLFVLGRMSDLFAAWRPDEFAPENAFRCQTCHGDDFDKPPVDFHMPRVGFPLSAEDPVGAAMKFDPEATTFMVEKVVPTMAQLLGEEPYDPATGKGTFGCFRCHPRKAAKRQ